LRRTKIVCTLGPASSTPSVVGRLVSSDVDVFRINFSHGDRNSHLQEMATIRSQAERHGKTVAILQDLPGPKIRVGKYRRRTGYRRHTGFRAATTRIEISLGAAKRAAAKKETPKVEAEAASAERTEPAEAVPVGLPEGYAQLTVAAIARDAKSWTPEELAAALAYESEHGKRKGALAALSSALSAAEEGSA